MADPWLPWLVLIADDLTGANDSGGQLARYGLPTVTYLEAPVPGAPLPRAAAVLFNSDSRHLAPAEAYRRLKELSGRLPSGRHLYKKVDSLLRGHLGQELDALLDTRQGAYALVAPAFPAQGRQTRQGLQTVNGEPVHQHPAARTSVNAPVTSHVGELLGLQSRRPWRLVGLDTVRQGPRAVEAALAACRREGAGLIVADAETDEDLLALVQGGLAYQEASGEKPIWTGTAGLAGALARELAARLNPPPTTAPEASPAGQSQPAGGLLLVCGTRSPITLAQIAALDPAHVLRLALDPHELARWARKPQEPGDPLEAGEPLPEGLQNALARARQALVERHDVLLMVADDGKASFAREEREKAGRPADSPTLEPLAIVAGLGRLVALVMEAVRPGAVFLSGGDTAQAVLHRLGVSSLWVVAEILPGIPACRAVDGPWQGLPVVTKSGGFGAPDALIRVVDYLRRDSLPASQP